MHISVTMPTRNSEWSIGLTARAALLWADSLVILNHASTDSTADIVHEIARENPGRVVVLNEPDPIWAEMEHRQRCLHAARQLGADTIAIVDDDELLSGNLIPRIRGAFEALGSDQMLELSWLCCWRSADQFRDRDASVWSRNWASTGFRDAPDLCWHNEHDGYCFHHRAPYPRQLQYTRPFLRHEGGLLHFQHASWRRLLAKQALYQMVEVIRWPGRDTPQAIAAKYGGTVDETGLSRSPVPMEWYAPYKDLMKHFDPDAEPWQERQCQRLLAEYGPEKFAGLNLFGVLERSVAA